MTGALFKLRGAALKGVNIKNYRVANLCPFTYCRRFLGDWLQYSKVLKKNTGGPELVF